jgi:hypothetical protein
MFSLAIITSIGAAGQAISRKTAQQQIRAAAEPK